jgi:hypothetical protein
MRETWIHAFFIIWYTIMFIGLAFSKKSSTKLTYGFILVIFLLIKLLIGLGVELY